MLARSARLEYRLLREADLDTFHGLTTDEHVRRYLLDGQVLPREWALEEIRASERLFEERRVGLWLVRDASGPIGFAGFRAFAEIDPAPQLVYALLGRGTGRGLATEMGQTLVQHAHRVGLRPIYASVDEVNVASVRVLEKLGISAAARRRRFLRPNAALRRDAGTVGVCGRAWEARSPERKSQVAFLG